ncbi:hypothetical protein [Pseudoalteromonas sp. NBT06-2]|uniref:hypothetical protein n=1 Tax=Pseudoalteromonas sp. NBT06-2 TaxID=2025950 RepID=UPI001481ECDD|nr:hypothetical protein [Pseudoalteromonas sp. NBT06-2]
MSNASGRVKLETPMSGDDNGDSPKGGQATILLNDTVSISVKAAMLSGDDNGDSPKGNN